MSRNPFAGVRHAGPGIVHFVSVLSRRARSVPSLPIRFPADGEWLLEILALDNRFVIGVHRRRMKVIGYLGKLDQLFGVSATTRSWSMVAATAKVLTT